MTTPPDTVAQLRPVACTGPGDAAGERPAGPARGEGADPLTGSPALTVATALLTQGLTPDQVRDLVATAAHLAEQVCQNLEATVATYGDDVAADFALNLAKLLCADALTSPCGEGPGPRSTPRAPLRLVPQGTG